MLRAILEDPDVRLHARRLPGWRRGRRWPALAICALAAVLSAPLLAPGWLAALLLLQSLALPGVLEQWEQDRRLDQIRMCGRPPARLLGAALLGAHGPLWIVAGVLLAAHAALAPHTLVLAVEVCLLTGLGLTAVGLLSFALRPGTARPQVSQVAVLVSVIAALSLGGLLMSSAATAGSPLEVQLALILSVVAVAAGAAYAAACRRLVRSPRRRRVTVPWARGVQRAAVAAARRGPPEFGRALAATFGSGGTLGGLAVAALLAVPGAVFDAQLRGEASGAVYLALLTAGCAALSIGGIAATSSFVDRDRRTGHLGLVRLTPQSPAAVLLQWTAASWLPLGGVGLALGLLLLVLERPAAWSAVSLQGLATLLLLPLIASVVALWTGAVGRFLAVAVPLGALSMASAAAGPVGLLVPAALAVALTATGARRLARGGT